MQTEDMRLRNLVHELGCGKWTAVAKALGNRSKCIPTVLITINLVVVDDSRAERSAFIARIETQAQSSAERDITASSSRI